MPQPWPRSGAGAGWTGAAAVRGAHQRRPAAGVDVVHRDVDGDDADADRQRPGSGDSDGHEAGDFGQDVQVERFREWNNMINKERVQLWVDALRDPSLTQGR